MSAVARYIAPVESLGVDGITGNQLVWECAELCRLPLHIVPVLLPAAYFTGTTTYRGTAAAVVVFNGPFRFKRNTF